MLPPKRTCRSFTLKENGLALTLLSSGLTEEPRGRGIPEESRREALGHFLRERRESLAPEQVGIVSHRGRRTPGLRREEVAFLADIGVKWYARLEAGDDVHPSTATLTGIAVALQLSNAELEYMLDLAGLRQRSVANSDLGNVPAALSALIRTLRGVSVSLCDRILTPMMWNSLAEKLYGHSRFADPVERNGLVRSLLDPESIAFLGTDRTKFIERAVGMFRLNLSSPSPSPFAAGVYEKVKSEELFQEAWQRRVIAGELTHTQVSHRNHSQLGQLTLYAVDLTSSMESRFLVRVLMPADDVTATKFRRLEEVRKSDPDRVALQLFQNIDRAGSDDRDGDQRNAALHHNENFCP